MVENLQIRQAAQDDIPFVIEAIIESEKGGTQTISTCRIFELSGNEFKQILGDILLHNIDNFDYSLSGFLIAERNGEKVGALGSWIEAAGGSPSGIIKATVLSPFINKTKIKEINKNTIIIKSLSINKKPGTLQLEHGYTTEKFRRQGIFTALIIEQIRRNYEKYNFKKVQGILFKENYKSYNALVKLGYKTIIERRVSSPEIVNFFPYYTKVLMELDEDTFSKLLQ